MIRKLKSASTGRSPTATTPTESVASAPRKGRAGRQGEARREASLLGVLGAAHL
jgi:hypothetical protein